MRPAVDYTLVVTVPDETGRICITSPDEPGLFIYAEEARAIEDIPRSVRLLRYLNRGAHKAGESHNG